MAAMKNGVIKINAFQILDDIAKKHNVKAQAWAKAAFGKPIFSSRISELRKLHTQHETGEYGIRPYGMMIREVPA